MLFMVTNYLVARIIAAFGLFVCPGLRGVVLYRCSICIAKRMIYIRPFSCSMLSYLPASGDNRVTEKSLLFGNGQKEKYTNRMSIVIATEDTFLLTRLCPRSCETVSV